MIYIPTQCTEGIILCLLVIEKAKFDFCQLFMYHHVLLFSDWLDVIYVCEKCLLRHATLCIHRLTGVTWESILIIFCLVHIVPYFPCTWQFYMFKSSLEGT